jgi:hypothetical protein
MLKKYKFSGAFDPHEITNQGKIQQKEQIKDNNFTG